VVKVRPLSSSLAVAAVLTLGAAAFAQTASSTADDGRTPPAADAPAKGGPDFAERSSGASAEAATAKSEPDPASPQPRPRGGNTHLGLSPQTTEVAAPSPGPPSVTEVPTSNWGFKFHGFFRGPMRLSMSSEAGRGPQFHAPPVTADLNYTTWSFTNNNPGP
jgi:hypothetical protein